MNMLLVSEKNCCIFSAHLVGWHRKNTLIWEKMPFLFLKSTFRLSKSFSNRLFLFLLHWFIFFMKIVKEPWIKEILLFCIILSNSQQSMAICLFLSGFSFFSLYLQPNELNFQRIQHFVWNFEAEKYNLFLLIDIVASFSRVLLTNNLS